MSHETLIQTVCADFFNVDPTAVKLESRLMGGMSNFTYIITVKDVRYTFRIPGKNAEKFVDRTVEKHHLELIQPLNLDNDTIYLDLEKGYKIARYIEGVPMHEKNPHDYLEQAADILKTIHQSGLTSEYDYDPLGRLHVYESHLKPYDHVHDARYDRLKARWMALKADIDCHQKTLTHGDSQISNFVVTDERLYLMDWEFSGNNDPFYDIACFGNTNFDHAIALLPVYLEKTPDAEAFNRLYFWRTFQCLQWHNVALYKAYIGLSADLKIDFAKVANLYLDKAEALLDKLK
ncbi:MAG: phosphotransferase [Acholeplasmatales bacterium]|nr:MAG: phosphotransferase [Acholeplasmatales bacterium]